MTEAEWIEAIGRVRSWTLNESADEPTVVLAGMLLLSFAQDLGNSNPRVMRQLIDGWLDQARDLVVREGPLPTLTHSRMV